MIKKVYLDYNATTPLGQSIVQAWADGLNFWGNPSSIHWASRPVRTLLRQTRQDLADLFGASSTEFIFTGGATEANNTVFNSLNELKRKNHPYFKNRNQILVSNTEHPSVIQSASHLQAMGWKVDWIKINQDGSIDLAEVQEQLSEQTALVSLHIANNETGVVYPIAELSKMVKGVGALFHTDAVQALGKMDIHLPTWGVDLATFSAHKFYSLKGLGVLYVKKQTPFEPLMLGGSQERKRRGGTENTFAVWSFSLMLKKLLDDQQNSNSPRPPFEHLKNLRDLLEQQIEKRISGVRWTGTAMPRLPNTSHMMISGIDGESLLMSLDLEGFAVSTGAACSSGNPEPSPVLINMGFSKQQAQQSLRVSLGYPTTKSDIYSFVDSLEKIVERLRKYQLNTIEREVNAI